MKIRRKPGQLNKETDIFRFIGTTSFYVDKNSTGSWVYKKLFYYKLYDSCLIGLLTDL